MAEANARDVEQRRRYAADARVRAARRQENGATAGVAGLRREGLYRSSGHARSHRRGRLREAAPRRRPAVQGAGDADALRVAASAALSRTQRTDRRAARPRLAGGRRMNDATPSVKTAPITLHPRNGNGQARRRLAINVLRYNPQEKGSVPRM